MSSYVDLIRESGSEGAPNKPIIITHVTRHHEQNGRYWTSDCQQVEVTSRSESATALLVFQLERMAVFKRKRAHLFLVRPKDWISCTLRSPPSHPVTRAFWPTQTRSMKFSSRTRRQENGKTSWLTRTKSSITSSLVMIFQSSFWQAGSSFMETSTSGRCICLNTRMWVLNLNLIDFCMDTNYGFFRVGATSMQWGINSKTTTSTKLSKGTDSSFWSDKKPSFLKVFHTGHFQRKGRETTSTTSGVIASDLAACTTGETIGPRALSAEPMWGRTSLTLASFPSSDVCIQFITSGKVIPILRVFACLVISRHLIARCYTDLTDRKNCRLGTWDNQGWNEVVANTVPLIRSMKTRILEPLPFSPTQ